jgi:hypothetical protein
LDAREVFDDLGEVIRTAIDTANARVWTSLPVKVLEDSDGFVVKVQPTIQGKRFDRKSGEQKDEDMPVLGKVPVQFAFGGGYGHTHPIKAGDEGIVVFSARMIDSWWDQGSEQPRPQLLQRRHNISDGMYIPGVRSKPRRLGGHPDQDAQMAGRANGDTAPASTTSYQIRTEKGDYYIELAPDGAVNIVCKTLTIKASEKVRIESPLVEVIDGEITAEKEITAKKDGSKVTLTEHRHRNVQGGMGESGPPRPGT